MDDGQEQVVDDKHKMTTRKYLPRKKDEECWTISGRIVLITKDLQLVTNVRELSNMHVNAYQNLIKKQFPHISVFQSTLLEVSRAAAIYQYVIILQHSKSAIQQCNLCFIST